MKGACDDVLATVGPVWRGAVYWALEDVPLDSYDAACVCTPDREKFAMLEYLLTHGKHLLVEKPLFAQTAAEEAVLYRVAKLARSGRAVCYTAYNHRFEPHLVRLREVIKSRVLGELHLVRGFYGNGTARDVRLSPWRDKGLGVLSDLGSHLLDLCSFFFGSIASNPVMWARHSFENVAADHALFGFEGRRVIH